MRLCGEREKKMNKVYIKDVIILSIFTDRFSCCLPSKLIAVLSMVQQKCYNLLWGSFLGTLKNNKLSRKTYSNTPTHPHQGHEKLMYQEVLFKF